MNDKSVLFLPRLPARLDVNQAAEVLGFLPHEVPVLMKVGLLRPLGRPAANGHKFFCAAEVLELSDNRDWLSRATSAISKRWQERNRAAKEQQTFQRQPANANDPRI
ncbi:MAG: hypothetical protein ABSE16_05555 [Verrucomicrobiota bacterium]|jgi:hypothetical protein